MLFKEVKAGQPFFWGGQQLIKTQELYLDKRVHVGALTINAVKLPEGSHHYFAPEEEVQEE